MAVIYHPVRCCPGWVGRAISPYLGFLTGWLMIAGTLIGTLSPVVALGPNVLAVFNAPTGNKWDNAILGTVLAAVLFIVSQAGLQGVVSPAKLQAIFSIPRESSAR